MTAGLTKRHHTFVQVAFPERELIFISRYSDFTLIKYKWSVVKQNCESFVERGLSIFTSGFSEPTGPATR